MNEQEANNTLYSFVCTGCIKPCVKESEKCPVGCQASDITKPNWIQARNQNKKV